MALIAKPGTPAEAAAAAVRTQVARLVAATRMHLANIRLAMGEKAGRPDVAAALEAADAAELAAFYSKAKALLAAVGETVEDLPA
jgi:biotin synthase-like enzyme